MTTLALGAAIVGVLIAPHCIPSQRISTTAGIVLWSSTLLLRAVLGLSLVVVLLFVVPATESFALLTRWCLQTVLPFLTSHLDLNGHGLGDVAVVVPGVLIAASLLSLVVGTWRGARSARRWVGRNQLGLGPGASVIISGSDVFVAAAGLRSPQVVISAGALVSLDDAELKAGLEHEWGHVRRRHRFISVAAHACRAVSPFLPLGKRALEQLHLHLERDADDYAVSRTGDPLALASAICKAAAGPMSRSAGIAALGGPGSSVSERLRRLSGPGHEVGRAMSTASAALATTTIALVLLLGAATSAVASADLHRVAEAQPGHAAEC